jgi:hypothetical protein
MSREEILAAVSTNLLTIATLESTEATKFNATAISGRIQALRDYNEVLKQGLRDASSGRSYGGGGGGPVDPKEEFRGGTAEQKMQEYLEAQRDLRVAAAEAEREMAEEQLEATLDLIADKNDRIIAAEEAALQARYELNMYFANQIVGVFSDSWEGGFDETGKNFKKMLDKMVKQLAVSGLLSAISNLAGGGNVGLFGQIFGGGGKGGGKIPGLGGGLK